MRASSTNGATNPRGRFSACGGRLLPLVVALLFAAPLVAQTGRIQGTIKGAPRPRGVKGASVMVARLDPDPPLAFDTKPDEQGRYHFDALPLGRYMILVARHEFGLEIASHSPIRLWVIVRRETQPCLQC